MLKKKIIIILIFMLTCCYSLNFSYAINTGTVYLANNQEVIEKGNEVEITINIENAKTAAFTSYLYFDNLKLEYISGPENTNVIDNRVIFVWYDTMGGSGAKNGELAKFKFRAKENGLATFTVQGEFYSEVGQLIQTDFKETQIQIGKEQTNLQTQAGEEQGKSSQSSNATLQVLRLDKEGVIPSFDKEIHEYYLTVSNDVQNIEVLAISENPNATIEIIGNTNLQEGLNLITIRVTSEDKTQSNVYTIEVTKTANLELANTNLEILAIENVFLNPPFDSYETNYKAEVSNTTETINLLAVPENERATVEVNRKDNLVEGNNIVTVIVTAQNGFTKKKYQVEVYKRNLEEEEKYQEEQKEKLEQAYKISELSTNSDENQEEIQTEDNEQKRNIMIWTMIILFVMIVSIVIFIYKKSKKS